MEVILMQILSLWIFEVLVFNLITSLWYLFRDNVRHL